MRPDWLDLARKNWQALVALAAFLAFAVGHATVFGPLAARYRNDVRVAAEMGMPVDLTGAPSTASASVRALLERNSLNAAVAQEQGTSGELTAGLLDELTRLAARHRLTVLSTEQGLVTQLPTTVQVRAHLRLRGSYGAFVDLLGDLARSRTLIAADRFTIRAGPGRSQSIDVRFSQLILKRTRSTP
jgi:hypothetical protein